MASLIERRSFIRGSSRLCSHNVFVNGLRFVWVIVVIWCEVGTFYWAISRCKWPDKAISSVRRFFHVLVCFLSLWHFIPGCLSRKTTACHAHWRRSNSASVHRILLDWIHSSFCLRFVPSQELERSKPFESSYCHISRGYARFGETCHKGRRVSYLLYSFKPTRFDYYLGMSCMWENSGRRSQHLCLPKSTTFQEMRTSGNFGSLSFVKTFHSCLDLV
jgi:hypothetical protein